MCTVPSDKQNKCVLFRLINRINDSINVDFSPLDRKRKDVAAKERTNKKNLFKYLGIDTQTEPWDGALICTEPPASSELPENLSKDVFILPHTPGPVTPSENDPEKNLEKELQSQHLNPAINHYHPGEIDKNLKEMCNDIATICCKSLIFYTLTI